MLSSSKFLSIAVLLAVGAGCESGRRSSAGFRLPPDGDAARGMIAFVALGCNSCHEVSGVDLPRTTAPPAVAVALGGDIYHEMTDGYLVTSIIYPSYRMGAYPKDQMMSGGQSRMPHYEDKMTVRQMTDIVAFLQSHYTVRRVAPHYMYR
jgi:sulfur-oxidizing protein SoxX